MPLSDTPLADAGDLATLTGRDATDPALVAALKSASARFRAETGTSISVVIGDVAVLDGDGSELLLLPHVPVTDVTAVIVLGTALTADDYEWSADGRLRRRAGWPAAYRAVQVTHDHGYDPVPDDVQAAVLAAAEAELATPTGVASMSVGGESVSYTQPGQLADAGWQRIVDHYRVG